MAYIPNTTMWKDLVNPQTGELRRTENNPHTTISHFLGPEIIQRIALREQLMTELGQQPNFGAIRGQAMGASQAAGNTLSSYHQQAMEAAGKVGGAARERINEDAIRNLASAQQGLTSRGMGNTTIRETTRRGVERDRQLSQRGVDEKQAQLRSGLLMSAGGQASQHQQAMAGLGLQADRLALDQFNAKLTQLASLADY